MARTPDDVVTKQFQHVRFKEGFDPDEVDWALGHAAVNGRFGEHDLASILAHHAQARPGPVHTAGEDHSLTQGTAGWAALGARPVNADTARRTELEGEARR